MLKPLLVIALALLATLSAGAQSDPLLDFRLDKRQVFYQPANNRLEIPTVNNYILEYSFEPNTQQSITAMLEDFLLVQHPFSQQTDDLWAGFDGYTSTFALDNAYPDFTDIKFYTWLGTQFNATQSWGRFQSGQYPLNNPMLDFSGFSATQNATVSLPISLTLNQNGQGLAGIDFEPYIELQIFDPVDYSVIYEDTNISQFSTQITIPGGALDPGQTYPARVRFICPDTLRDFGINNPYPVLSRRLKETWFLITTRTQAGAVAPILPDVITVTMRSSFQQPNQAQLTANGVSLDATFPDIANVTSVSLGQPLATTAAILKQTDDTGPFTYSLSDFDEDDFLGGLLTAAVKFDNDESALSVRTGELTGAFGGSAVGNWEAIQNVQSPVDYPLIMSRPSGLVTGFTAELEIRNQQGDLVATGFAFAGAENELELTITGGDLQPNTNYNALVRVQPFGNNNSDGINLLTVSETSFTLHTAPTSWPGVSAVNLIRGAYFDNETGETPPNDIFTFTAEVVETEADALSAANIRLDRNNQPITALTRADDTVWALEQAFEEESALDNAWGDGFYRIATTQTGGSAQSGSLELANSSGTFPETRIDTTRLGSGELDPSLPVPVSWTGFAATGNAAVSVSAFDALTDSLLYTGELVDLASNGLSGYIPGGALPGNRDVTLRIGFRQVATNDTTSFPGVTLTAAEEHWTLISATTGEAQYGHWQQFKFTVEQRADPSISGPLANPDGDLFNNLAEFAINGQPLSPTSPPGILDSGSRWSFRFQMRRDYPLLQYQIAYSTTLDPPFTPYTGQLFLIESGADYDTVEARFTKGPRIFVDFDILYLEPLGPE